MNETALMRIVDENLDRLAEGLRVLEDLARMLLNDAGLTSQLKALRHDLIRGDLDFNLELLQSRESARDVGENLPVAGDKAQDLPLIAVANARRAQEALRVLEELSKLPELAEKLNSEQFKTARFKLYSNEKELVARITRQDKATRVKGLYVIVDTQYLAGRDPLEATECLLSAGVRVVQLRSKNPDKKLLINQAAEMQTLCRRNGALFIVNDHLDVALAVHADGLHIGQDDLPAAVARRLLPIGALLGVSAATVEEALGAADAGADYLGIGSIFPTSSKENIRAVGPARINQIREATRLPLVAIGGINCDNIAEVRRAGADSACVISAVLGAPDMESAARQLIQIIEDK